MLVSCGYRTHFPGRWTGRRGSVDWPPRSPDLTPLDFFLWGVLKDRVYAEKPKTIRTLKRTIRDHIRIINNDKELLEKVCRSVKVRFEKCIELKGTHIEPYI